MKEAITAAATSASPVAPSCGHDTVTILSVCIGPSEGSGCPDVAAGVLSTSVVAFSASLSAGISAATLKREVSERRERLRGRHGRVFA